MKSELDGLWGDPYSVAAEQRFMVPVESNMMPNDWTAPLGNMRYLEGHFRVTLTHTGHSCHSGEAGSAATSDGEAKFKLLMIAAY